MNTDAIHSELKVHEGAAVWRDIDGEVVLLALRSSRYLALNETASVLWPKLVGGTSRDELMHELARHYDVDADQAASDVDAFLRACRQERLLA